MPVVFAGVLLTLLGGGAAWCFLRQDPGNSELIPQAASSSDTIAADYTPVNDSSEEASPPASETPPGTPDIAAVSPVPVAEIKPPQPQAPPPQPQAPPKADVPVPTPPKKAAVLQPKPQEITPLEPPAKKPAGVRVLPKDEQAEVNAAIDRGVRIIKAQQLATGTWGQSRHGGHDVGCAALPGLTLLESQVSPKDPVVQQAASYVRRNTLSLTDTYDLSLAILFLDRLGEADDKPLIQQLALRIVAGQTEAGGWDYHCPLLGEKESFALLRFLQQTQPRTAQPTSLPTERSSDDRSLPKDRQRQEAAGKALPRQSGETTPATRSGAVPPDDAANLNRAARKDSGTATSRAESPDKESKASKKKTAAPKVPATRVDPLPANLRNLPVVTLRTRITPVAPAARMPTRMMFHMSGHDDNSNSQFAMLALWVARRDDVPTERSLRLADKRYQATQNANGGWGYQIGMPSKASMTGVGLLGLAMGHGASASDPKAAAEPAIKKKTPGVRDRAIKNGLAAFATTIGGKNDPLPPHANLYFLWTVERVAMLYDLKTIGGKDWYRWGVGALLRAQHDDGSWHLGGYPGAEGTVDTCFALLFLNRSNLVQDLTRQLNLRLSIPESSRSQK